MDQVNTFQEAINKRASEKLNADLHTLGLMMQDIKLLQAKDGSQYEQGRFPRLGVANDKGQVFDCRNPTNLFGADTLGREKRVYGPYLRALYEYWLPIYVQRETDLLMASLSTLVTEKQAPDGK